MSSCAIFTNGNLGSIEYTRSKSRWAPVCWPDACFAKARTQRSKRSGSVRFRRRSGSRLVSSKAMPGCRSPGCANAKPMAQFLAITFGLTWGIALLVIVFPDAVFALFGEISVANPLFILAVYSPGIAGVVLVLFHHGRVGLIRFFRRFAVWRVPAGWWLFVIAGIPAVMYAGAGLAGTIRDPLPFTSWWEALGALALALFLGPIEELGWRGLALPLLQRRFAPLWAGLILGVVWAVWHV